jgi:L-fuculose-phosphate aldolase
MAKIKRALMEEVAKSAHMFWEKKLTPGMDSGDTSLRDPKTGLIYILPQPSARQPIRGWNTITAEDVAVIDIQGNVVGPPENLPTVEAPMHLSIYEARPDVNAIVHSHGVWSQIFAAVRQDIPCLTIDAYHFLLGEVKCAEFGRVGSEALAKNIVKALGSERRAASWQVMGRLVSALTFTKHSLLPKFSRRQPNRRSWPSWTPRARPTPGSGAG